MKYSADIQKIKRTFIPEGFIISNWQNVEPFFKSLLSRKINSESEFLNWLSDLSELEAVVNEDACLRQIKSSCDTENKELEEAYNFYCTDIQPQMQPYVNEINKKFLNSPFLGSLDKNLYGTLIRNTRKNIELFNEKNIAVQSEISVLQQEFGRITGRLTVNIDGEELTLQQAGKFLLSSDREKRKEAYFKINECRLSVKNELNILFNKLLQLRNEEAKNAGFENYVSYRYKELGRFDYSENESYKFHDAIKQYVVPLLSKIYVRMKEKLGIDKLRPWDLDADTGEPLRPFGEAAELLEKTICCVNNLDTFFGDCLTRMQQDNKLDLASRKGKAPGGFNCPLPESGVPFIFMNATGQPDDVTTLIHEAGHAVHSFLAHHLKLTSFKEYPMEIAEVASMSMELMTMDYWNTFYKNESDLKKAKTKHLEEIILLLPWIAAVDKFQHWIYLNSGHTDEQRDEAWLSILKEFSSEEIDYTGLEEYRKNQWRKQLHIFEVPFYYIEYGIAQLGAIGIWKQYKENPESALSNYCNALKLGGTKTLPELYKTAGLEFDFSPQKVKTLIEFVSSELDKML